MPKFQVKTFEKLLSGPKFDLNGNLFRPDNSEKTYFASFFGISENDAFTVDHSGFRFKNFDPKSEIGLLYIFCSSIQFIQFIVQNLKCNFSLVE